MRWFVAAMLSFLFALSAKKGRSFRTALIGATLAVYVFAALFLMEVEDF